VLFPKAIVGDAIGKLEAEEPGDLGNEQLDFPLARGQYGIAARTLVLWNVDITNQAPS